jgi:hypothetical protein
MAVWCGGASVSTVRLRSMVVGWLGCEVGTGPERWSYMQVGVCTIAMVYCECDACATHGGGRVHTCRV